MPGDLDDEVTADVHEDVIAVEVDEEAVVDVDLEHEHELTIEVAERQGLRGPPGPRGEPGASTSGHVLKLAAEPIGSGLVVRAHEDPAYVRVASSLVDEDAFAISGIAINTASTEGTVEIVRSGEISDSEWLLEPLKPIFVGSTGRLVQTVEPGWRYVRVVGFALSPTRAMIDLSAPIFRGD